MRDPKELYVRFNFHPELCVCCGACVTACMYEHDGFPAVREPLRRLYRTEYTKKARPPSHGILLRVFTAIPMSA